MGGRLLSRPIMWDGLSRICEGLGIVKPVGSGQIAENLYAVKAGPVNFFIYNNGSGGYTNEYSKAMEHWR